MLIQEAKRFQKLAGIKEEQGYYTTPTNDPKTAQVHFTTDEKPSLSKSYKALSPKSQRKDELTPEAIEKALISALRDNKMDYEKSITIVSDKLNVDKNKLKQDFPKNDMIYKAGSIDEIVNEALIKFRITEAEVNAEQAAEKGLNDFLGDLKSAASSIKPSPKDGEIKEGLVTLYSLVVGAPGILDLLGKGADLIGQYFSGGAVQKTQIGTALQKAGHKLEHKYIEGIAYVLKKAYPQSYEGDNVFDEKSALHDAAHGIYAALLAAGAIGAGWQAADATNIIVKGLEGGAAAFKSAEVVQLAQKIASA